MDFYKLVRKRESVRSYDPDRPVEKNVLERILNAGRLAPSAVNYQPWRFLLVSSPEMLAKVRACYAREWFADTPHILIVVGKRDEAWVRKSDGYNSLETDVTIALDHMILAAEYEGVGTCWIGAFDPDALRNALSLADNEIVYSLTPIGYPKAGYTRREKKRKPLAEVVEYI